MLLRTQFLVTVLSDRLYEPADNLYQIAHDIDEGDCVGVVRLVGQVELSPEQMATALIAAGSDPEFFDLADPGHP